MYIYIYSCLPNATLSSIAEFARASYKNRIDNKIISSILDDKKILTNSCMELSGMDWLVIFRL